MMKRNWILLAIVPFAFIEATLIPLNISLLFVISWVLKRDLKNAAWIAFITGIIVDLVAHRTLGISSLALLSISALVFIVQRRATTQHMLVTMVMTFIASIVMLIVWGYEIEWLKIGLQTLLVAVIKPLVSFIDDEVTRESGIQLDFRDKVR